MKKLWFVLAMMTCIFASCSDGGSEDPVNPTPKPEEVKTEITIDSGIVSNGLSFGVTEGEQSISFSVNANWTLSIASTTSGATWCKASVTSGSKGTANVKFTVEENTGYEDRSVSVTIKAGSVSKTFTITQKGADALLVTTNKYEVAQEGGQIEIEVKANIDYQMEISEAAKSWITEASSRALNTYKHTLDITLNEDAEKREGEITFKSGDKVETVKVYQSGGALILLSQDEYTVNDAGETISVDVKSNVEYGVQMPDVDWITDEASSRGMSSHTLKYVIAANEGYDSRSAEIIFYDKNSDLKDTLRIVQAQKDAIILSQKEFNVKSEGETIEVKLSTNVNFEVAMPDVDWISQTESRSLEKYTLLYKISANKEDNSRTSEIIYTNKDSGIEEKLIIVQEAAKQKVDYTVNVETAGTLSSLIEDTLKYVINSLRVTGYLNGDDIRFLREMAGNDYNGKNTDGKLRDLDMTQSCIVKGGRYYKTANEAKDNTFGSSFFRRCNSLEYIKLPLSITSIEDSAFDFCENLSNVELSDKLTYIGNRAFYYCSKLSTINIPNSVKEIGISAFQRSGIKSITIPNGVSIIKIATFASCKELTNVSIPASVTKISRSAFLSCTSLSEINLPVGLIEIESDAFANTNLSEIVLPNTLIGLNGFSKCKNLTKIEIPNSVKRIGGEAFRNCENLTSVILSEGLQTLYGFDYCTSLTHIEIPNGVDTLSAFDGCTNLASINIPESVTYLSGFSDCTSLKEISIPKNVKVIGFSAFSGCKNIKEFELPEGLKVIDAYAFYECKPINLNIPSSVEEIGFGAFWLFGDWDTKNLSYVCNLETIANYTFCGCIGLESITFTEKTKKIGDNTFSNCMTLKEVKFSDNITYIGDNAFENCLLDSITAIPGNIGYIAKNAFSNTNIKSAVLSEGIHTIMPSAFKNCSEIRKLNLPKTLEHIYEKAFYNCTQLVEIYCDASTPPAVSDSTAFDNIDKSKCKLYVPKDCAKTYKSAEHWKDFTNIIEM